MNSVYPVNSFYFTTASTCPLQALGIGTWQKVGSSIITSINTDVPVKGNGMTLGLTNGSLNYGIVGNSGTLGQSSVYTGIYGQPVGTAYSGNVGTQTASTGVTEDASKSGIVGTVTRTSLTVNIFKRTA